MYILVKETNEVLRVTRIDSHVYPICADYRRFSRDSVIFLKHLPNIPN